MPTWTRWTSAVLSLCVGCATSIHERRIMQATDEGGRVGYYQIQIDGSAKLAKATYRSGLYDPDALDALFGSVQQGAGDINEVLARRRSEAVDRLAAAYYQRIEQSDEAAPVELAEWRLALALRSPYLVAANRDLAGRAVDRRKYAVILSAKASEIEKAIADFAEAQQTTDAVLTALAAQKRTEFLRVLGESERLGQARAFLARLRADADALEQRGPGATPQERAQYVQQAADLLDSLLRVEVP
jgi:hypothetical protein